MNDWGHVFLNSFSALGAKVMTFIPNLIGALVLLVVAVLLAGFLRKFVEKGLGLVGVDRLPKRLFKEDASKSFEGNGAPSVVIGKVVYWLTILVFLLTISETLGWTVVTEKTSDLISYMPQLLSAVIIFVVGYFIASFVRNALQAAFGGMSMAGARPVGQVAFYIILMFITVTALDQAGVDTTLLTANISIIIGAVMVAFSVAFAWASKDLVRNILSFVYGRSHFEVGQQVAFDDISGRIISIDHMHVVIRNGDEDTVVPTRDIVDAHVRVKRSGVEKG